MEKKNSFTIDWKKKRIYAKNLKEYPGLEESLATQLM